MQANFRIPRSNSTKLGLHEAPLQLHMWFELGKSSAYNSLGNARGLSFPGASKSRAVRNVYVIKSFHIWKVAYAGVLTEKVHIFFHIALHQLHWPLW